MNGPHTVGSAAAGTVSASVSTRSVAGVPVIELHAERAAGASTGCGHALIASSETIDRAAGAFEVELDALLELSAAELNLRRLTAPAAYTTRQVSALERVVIPRLAGRMSRSSGHEIRPGRPGAAP